MADGLLNRMKLALRVSNDHFDDEINGVIQSARMELIRAGVSPTKANADDDELIISAIRAYVLATYSTDVAPQASINISEGYWESFRLQADNLRKSTNYSGGGDVA